MPRVTEDKAQITITVDVRDWLEDVYSRGELFNSRHGCGYWLHGVDASDDSWLCYVDPNGEGVEPPVDDSEQLNDHDNAARYAWRHGFKLAGADGYYTITEVEMLQVIEDMVREHGAEALEPGAYQFDNAVQRVLLGEVRFA